MQFQLFKPISLYFFIYTAILFLHHASPSKSTLAQIPDDTNLQYQNCSTPFQCGNITNISYPFWGSNRPYYCGHPGFQLNCTDQTPLIKINQLTYKILKTDEDAPILVLARTDYIDSTCPSLLYNTTLDLNLFNFISTLQNITFYYGCSANEFQNRTHLNEFSCGVHGNVSVGYFLTGGLSTSSKLGVNYSSVESCKYSVIVPAFESAVAFVESSPSQENLILALNQGFGLKWNANDSLCESCLSSGGMCGYNATANSFVCHCPDRTESFSCSGVSKKNVKFSLHPAAVATIAAAVFSICLVCCCLSTRKGRFWAKTKIFGLKKTEQDEKIETFIMNYQSLIAKRYSYWDISRMTKSFADKLGQGGFGGVYKGKLPDGRLVAIKVLNKSTRNGEEFINEVATISRTSHVNIVNLLGFCFERTKRALIYEYLPNGSLDNYIGSQRLEWKTLYAISIGIARGLEYLHRGCSTMIVHFDIKPHNILLDENFCPKISDFGLAKLCKGRESIVSMLGARGTAGYIAPEVFMRDFGGVSYKSDVYSYGMMLLEMFGGKNTTNNEVGVSQSSEIYFSDWIYKHLEPGVISRLHYNVSEEDEEIVRKMIIIGIWCIQANPSERPSMTKVVEMLEDSLESLQVPPKPQLFTTSNRAPKFSSAKSISSSSLSSSYLWLKKEEEKALSSADIYKLAT